MVASPKVGTAAGISYSTGTSSATTPSQVVTVGQTVYVQVAMYGTGLSAPSVTDSETGAYSVLASGHNGSVYLWVFRRNMPVTSSGTFTTTVTPSSSTVPIEVVSIPLYLDAGVDVVSTVSTGTGTSETSTVSTDTSYDTILFLGADHSGSFSSWGSGQTGISSYPTPPTNVSAWGSFQTQGAPGAGASGRNVTASVAWVAVSVSVTPQVVWSGLWAKPGVTVSSIGLSTTPAAPIANNGADFGPDTPGTTTSGINEAVNSGARSVYLLPGEFNTSSSVYLPSNYGISLVGNLSNQNFFTTA